MDTFDPLKNAAICCVVEIDPKELGKCDMIVVELEIQNNEKGIVQQIALNYGASQTEDTF